jgi:hypothetical protein
MLFLNNLEVINNKALQRTEILYLMDLQRVFKFPDISNLQALISINAPAVMGNTCSRPSQSSEKGIHPQKVFFEPNY